MIKAETIKFVPALYSNVASNFATII